MQLTVLDATTEWSRFTEGSIERRMLIALSERLGIELRPKPLMLPNDSRVEVEGIDGEGRVLALWESKSLAWSLSRGKW